MCFLVFGPSLGFFREYLGLIEGCSIGPGGGRGRARARGPQKPLNEPEAFRLPLIMLYQSCINHH